jgi:RHS repeat-associated protein
MEQVNNGKRYSYQTDGLDSIVALTNETGKLVSPFLYDEYGQILAGDTDLQIFTYTAQDYDPETGLHHFYARYYDPARGVWLTQDPYRGRLAEPGTLQRYGYVYNRPTVLADSYGYFVCGGLWVVGVYAAGAVIIAIGTPIVTEVAAHLVDPAPEGTLGDAFDRGFQRSFSSISNIFKSAATEIAIEATKDIPGAGILSTAITISNLISAGVIPSAADTNIDEYCSGDTGSSEPGTMQIKIEPPQIMRDINSLFGLCQGRENKAITDTNGNGRYVEEKSGFGQLLGPLE